MIRRRDFLSGLAGAVALAGPALAQDYVASVVSQLRAMGFNSIKQERTLLGRVRIIASRSDGRREIIINPSNGEILRDLWMPSRGEKGTADIIADKSGRSGNGSGGGKDDDDDDTDDDGEGGGGSGSGNGGGGNDDGDDEDEDEDDDDDDEGDDESGDDDED